MIPNLDIWRAPALLVRRYGTDAITHAADTFRKLSDFIRARKDRETRARFPEGPLVAGGREARHADVILIDIQAVMVLIDTGGQSRPP